LKITLLGTGTSLGVPVIGCDCEVCASSNRKDRRLRTSLLVEGERCNFVIDAGPDFREQMLTAKIKHLSAVVLTHEHRDHVAGLDDVRAFNWHTKAPVVLFGEERVLNSIQHTFSYAFSAEKYPGVPDFDLNQLTEKPFSVCDIELIPIRVYHHRLPVLGYRIGDFAYLTDLNSIPDDSMLLLKGIKILIIDALRYSPHISHFSITEAIEVSRKVGAPKVIFTHMSHEVGLHEKVNENLPEGFELGYDGMQINL